MSHVNKRRKNPAPRARANTVVCNKCRRKNTPGERCPYRCYCVETEERSQVIGRRRKKRARARRERRTRGGD